MIRLMLVLCLFSSLHSFDKVIIWGHKLHSHTHSYIHNGFYHAFKSLGIPTFWFDDQDDVSNFDFSNSFFLTEGQVDKNVPLLESSFYLVHNPSSTKYNSYPTAILQVYTDDVLLYPTYRKVVDCIFYDLENKALVMPWATDLLPTEIDEVKKKLPSVKKNNQIWWIGTFGDGTFGNRSELEPFFLAAIEKGFVFKRSDPWAFPMSVEDHVEKIASAYMAPAIVGAWQKKMGYIPCRIFKNISYGQIGITNSYRTYELFQKKIVYNSDTELLFVDAQKALETYTLEKHFELMDFIRDNHTYINRAQTILDFLSKIDPPALLDL